VSTLDQFSTLAATYHFWQTTSLASLEEVKMENLVELMQRLLEIQSGGRQRSAQSWSPKGERLMDGLQKKHLAEKPTQTVQLTQDGPEQMRFQCLTTLREIVLRNRRSQEPV
jgi:hypothetical protein